MSSASVTNIPTGPQSSAIDPQAAAWSAIAGLATATGKAVQDGRGGSWLPGVVAAVLCSGLIWGVHEVAGGNAASERTERINERFEKLESQQTEIRIQLASIQRAVGAE